jgi:hypothetical protein
MPILSGSALRPKQVSMTTTAAKTINLQPIIGFSVLVYRWGIKKLENSGLFHCGAQAARRMSDRLPTFGTESQAKSARQPEVWENAPLFAADATPLVNVTSRMRGFPSRVVRR